MRESQATINEWAEQTFGPVTSGMRLGIRMNKEMAELLTACAHGHPEQIAEEAADILIMLYRIAGDCAFNLHEVVDKKMAVNRKRKWVRFGDGTGTKRA